VGAVGGSNHSIATMTGNNSTATLNLPTAPVHENNVQVYFDGIYQSKSNFSVSGTTITFSTAPPTGVLVEAILAKATNISTATQLLDADEDTKIQVEESSDEDVIRMDVAGTEVLTLTNSAMTLKGTAPALIIGDAGAEDTKIVFDGNAQDYYIGLDDSADDLVIGKGSAVGTTPAISIDENINTTFAGNITIPADGTIASASGDITLDAPDDIFLDADGGNIRFKDAGTTHYHFSNGGNDINTTYFADSGSNEGAFRIKFNSDGSSTDQWLAYITMQQGSGDGGSQKSEMLFGVADNGNPSTAMTIANNKRVTAHSSLLVGQTSDNGMSGNGIESAGSIRANNFILSTDLAGSGFRNVNASANGTITTSTSLRELKENIVDMSLGLSDVLKLKPREFDWKDAVEHGTEDIGFIADEVFDVSSKLATYKVGEKTKDNLQGVKYDTMTSLLVKAIQELSTELETAKARIKTLEDA